MKKIIIPKAGGYKQLQIREFPNPEPHDDEVQVLVKACGINFADVVIRQGLYASAKEYIGWPITPGFEFAGIVEQVGKNIDDIKAGEKVFGVSLFGAQSSHISVPRKQIFYLPKNFSFEEAAAFPATFMTAYHALFENVVIRPEMKMLIHSAAGGMGTSLLQLAKVIGCETVGIVNGEHKVDIAKKFGANFVIDKSKRDLWKEAHKICPEGYDIILDGNGPSTLKNSYKHLKPTGKLISYGFHSMFSKRGGYPNYLKLAYEFFKVPRFNPLDLTQDNKSIISFNLSFLFDRMDILERGMNLLLNLIDEERIIPPQIKTYPFEKVADAHRDLESGKTTGKLVLTL